MRTLYNFATSPYGWMARIALAEKGLEYTTIEPRDRETNPELRRLNPINRTPVLVEDDGTTVFESLAVMEYLDDRYPLPALRPAEPAGRARARAMALLSYLYIQPESRAVTLALFDYARWDRSATVFPPRRPLDQVDHAALRAAEARLSGYLAIADAELGSRPWLSGPTFGIADIALIPSIATYKLRGAPLASYANLTRWLAACHDRRTVRDTATPLVKSGRTI